MSDRIVTQSMMKRYAELMKKERDGATLSKEDKAFLKKINDHFKSQQDKGGFHLPSSSPPPSSSGNKSGLAPMKIPQSMRAGNKSGLAPMKIPSSDDTDRSGSRYKQGGKVKKSAPKKMKGGGKIYTMHEKRYAHGGKVSGRKPKYNV